MQDITEPLRLAVGSHEAGSGKGCAMNVISWENGDTTITDVPACADPFLARVVQRVNDAYCTHAYGDLLCPPCSVEVLALAHRTVGTALGVTNAERAEVYAWIAHEIADTAANSANSAARYATACAADAAAYAATSANAAAADYAANSAAHAATSAVGGDAGSRLARAHQLIDRFEEITGVRSRPVPEETTANAVAAMCGT